MEVSSHALALHRADAIHFAVARLHQPDPGPPRLPRATWRTTSAPSACLFSGGGRQTSRRRRRQRRRSLRRRLAAELPRPASLPRPSRLRAPRSADFRALRRLLRRRRVALPLRRARRARPRSGRRCPGHFNVANALAALAAAHALGVDLRRGRRGARRRAGRVPGRFEPVDEGQPFAVLVDYAHTPDSLENVLRAARRLTEGRLISVFGCGGDRDRDKRPKMGRVGGASSPTLPSSPPTTRAPRTRRRSSPRSSPGSTSGAASVEVEPDRRAAIALALGRGGAGRHGGDRRQGPRAGPGVRGRPEDPLRRPRGGREELAQAGGPAR